ncbi:alpha-ketoglutarate decarboxylase, partial [Mycobacteroides abscessus subsp. bolletii 1S-153-0915]
MNGSNPQFGQNEWLVEEMYRRFKEDPSSVDSSWHEFLSDFGAESVAEPATAS